MTTILWKTAAPFGTCRSRYKARRAAAVAARLREKKLIRKIGDLLGHEGCATISLTMRRTFLTGYGCPHCGLPGPGHLPTCSFCAMPVQTVTEK